MRYIRCPSPSNQLFFIATYWRQQCQQHQLEGSCHRSPETCQYPMLRLQEKIGWLGYAVMNNCTLKKSAIHMLTRRWYRQQIGRDLFHLWNFSEFGITILNYNAQTQINYSNSISEVERRGCGFIKMIESDSRWLPVNLTQRKKVVNDSRDIIFCVRRQWCLYIERVRQSS